MRLLTATLRKLLHRPATRITLLVLVALVALVFISIGTSFRAMDDPSQLEGADAILRYPGAFASVAAMLVVFAGLAAAAFGAMVAGSEWSWHTFRLAVARGESRPGYVLLTLTGLAVLLLLGWLILFTVAVLLVPIGAVLAGLDPGDPTASGAPGRLLSLVAGGWWAIVMHGTLGFAVAFVARSAVAGVVAVVAIYFAEQFAAMVLPAEVLRVAPISSAAALVAEAGRGAGGADLLVPLLATTLYVVVASLAASAFARRTEVA